MSRKSSPMKISNDRPIDSGIVQLVMSQKRTSKPNKNKCEEWNSRKSDDANFRFGKVCQKNQNGLQCQRNNFLKDLRKT